MREADSLQGSEKGGSRAGEKVPASGGRGTLSREQILQAALAIADRDGLGGLTIRKLAARLGVSPMGVYRYFRNKAEIVGGLVDLVAGEYKVASHQEDDWAEWVRETFCLMRKALLAHPGIIPLLGTAASSGPNAMAEMDAVLNVLGRAGIDRHTGASAFFTMISYTIGAVAIESHVQGENADESVDPEERRRQLRLLFEMASRPGYPSIVDLTEHPAFFASDEEFVRGLDRILTGLRADSEKDPSS